MIEDYYIAALFGFLGFVLIFLEHLSDSKKHGYLHNIIDNGFDTQKLENKFLPRKQKKGNIIPFRREINTYNKNEVLAVYKKTKIDLKERVNNENVEFTIIGGLGSFPHLYLVGTQFASGYSIDVEVLDYNRDKNKWYANKFVGRHLDYKINFEDISVKDKMNQLKYNNSNEVGIAISNTYSIDKDSIPEHLKNNTLFLILENPNINSCDSKRTQLHLIKQINILINELSNTKKKIHLFVSARASFTIRMGMNYTPRSTGEIVLHNYSKQKRDWSISLHNNIVT